MICNVFIFDVFFSTYISISLFSILSVARKLLVLQRCVFSLKITFRGGIQRLRSFHKAFFILLIGKWATQTVL